MAKRIYRALGRKLAAAKLFEHPDDVYYLTTEEVAGAVRGHLVTHDLKGLVALRRREHEAFARLKPAPRIVTHGPVYARPFPQASVEDAAPDGQVLRGLGCSAGRVSAPAKVILDPTSDLKIQGEVLVAPMTDPGWVFLMVAAGGIVSEKGSLLSHTAIIGRELGIPTVVGIKGATRLIADGRRVTLDGAAGTVTLE
jgi:pyruvate,water dikinase